MMDVGKLTDRASVTGQYENVLWRIAQKNRLNQLEEDGQLNLNLENNLKVKTPSKPVKNDSSSTKTTQAIFKGGDTLKMDMNPDLGNPEVVDSPKGVTVEGEITEVVLGSRAEVYNLDDGEQPKYGQRDDQIINYKVNVVHDGTEYTVYDSFPYYDSPSDRSSYGKFIGKYDKPPQQGATVTVSYDLEGNGEVVY